MELLSDFLPKPTSIEKSPVELGVSEPKLGAAIQQEFNIPCLCNRTIDELMRGIRLHFLKFIKLDPEEHDKAQLALAHAYSRSEVKFDVNRTDNMVKQAVFLFDQMEKDINLLAMRVKEWYGGHFPELGKIVIDNQTFCKIVLLVKDKRSISTLSPDHPAPEGQLGYTEMLSRLEDICKDSAQAQEVMAAAQTSAGYDLYQIDLDNILRFSEIVVNLFEYREKLRGYLTHKMNSVAPNLTALLGVTVASRLVSHAGSLTALAKSPASTIQILGAEKALFRALKSRKNTPKYGLLYNSSFVQKALAKNKGRISRFLANKCALASRIDNFAEDPTSVFGDAMHEQVEDRLEFFKTHQTTKKNLDVMREACQKVSLFFFHLSLFSSPSSHSVSSLFSSNKSSPYTNARKLKPAFLPSNMMRTQQMTITHPTPKNPQRKKRSTKKIRRRIRKNLKMTRFRNSRKKSRS